jgi:transcriptional regulator with XRE-family HTH domain
MSDTLHEEEDRIVDLLQDLLDRTGITVRELERQLGLSRGARRRVFAGEAALTYRIILETAGVLELKPEEFFLLAFWKKLTEQGNFDPDAKIQEIYQRLDRLRVTRRKRSRRRLVVVNDGIDVKGQIGVAPEVDEELPRP